MPSLVASPRPRYPAWLAAGLLAGVLVWGELVSWRSSRRLPPGHPGPRLQAVVVLGFRNRGQRANAVNRWRVRAGLRSVDPTARQVRLVLCGGPVAGPVSEAALMADYARRIGYRGELVLEEVSRSTWENVACLAHLVADADQVTIVSQPHHVEKACRYLRRQRPDLARRLGAGQTYRLGEWTLAKPLLAAYGTVDLYRSRRDRAPV